MSQHQSKTSLFLIILVLFILGPSQYAFAESAAGVERQAEGLGGARPSLRGSLRLRNPHRNHDDGDADKQNENESAHGDPFLAGEG